MTHVKWGIIGPGDIAANFAQGLSECDSGTLIAIASRNSTRRKDFGDRFNVPENMRFSSYEAMADSDAIDAIYIATPHPFHAELAIMALRAGKHVVCEKPAGLITGEVIAVTDTARQENRFFMEGLMYRCHPQIARVVEIIRNQEIGTLRHISTSFGFDAPFDATSRLYDPELAGGAILDVGAYPVSLARLIAGAATGQDVAEPISIAGTGTLADSGVDQTAYATLLFPNDITAQIATAVSLTMDNDATITGTKGTLHIPNPWVPGRNEGPSDATIFVTIAGETRIETFEDPRMLFAHEAETASQAIINGQIQAPHPAPSWADSIGTMKILDSWRAQTGYLLPAETPNGMRRLAKTLPNSLPKMPMARIPGLDRDISQLIIGCDNRDTLAEGAIIWDAWIEAGGNTFDTGFVYGGGRHEAILGNWISARNMAKDITVIVKGAHSPYCSPRTIATQLEISLERLQLEHAPIYIMHRDNPDVPVSEFMDALNDLHSKGLIGAFGGSNWSIERFAEANAYAAANNLKPMTILNNNLSLAVMEQPVWDGCITANSPKTLAFLRETNTAHLSWSSQARGFFYAAETRTVLSEDTAPDTCFASEDNTERRRRAAELAKEKGVETPHIATAWVMGQSFPSFALIGPRSPNEIATTLPAATVSLTGGERAWLNLEADSR